MVGNRGLRTAVGITAITAGLLGSMAVPASASASDSASSIVIQAADTRRTFDCQVSGRRDSACGHERISVARGKYLCFATRGSKGHPISYRGVDTSTGRQTGVTRGLRVGDQRQCVWKNTTKRTVKFYFRARATDRASVTVHGTAYGQSRKP